MTIELTSEDLSEVGEQAARYGACMFKTKTTDGDDVWIAVQGQRKQQRTRKATPAEQQQQGAAQPLTQ